jgi:ATP synthase protein I
MKDDMQKIFISTIFYDVIIGFLISIICLIVYKAYLVFFIIGLSVAIINFVISALTMKMLSPALKMLGPLIHSVVSVIRVIAIAMIGALILNNSANSCIAYMLGFCTHFISLVVYSLKTIIFNEGK